MKRFSDNFARLLAALLLATAGCQRPTQPGEGVPNIVTPDAPKPAVTPSTVEKGWESSGGGGVACFQSEADAAAAEASLADKGFLPKTLRDRLTSVVTLERWEYEAQWPSKRWGNKPHAQIYAEIQEIFAQYSPIFYSRLELVEGHIARSKWTDNQRLPRIEDANPARPVKETDPKCRVIQLAVRHTKTRAGYLPEARVEVDEEIFEKYLSPLDQAMLILHENIYLMARELVHKNSDAVRLSVAIFFSDQFASDIQKLEQREAEAKEKGITLRDTLSPEFLVQGRINALLGDYYLYFNSDPEDRPTVVPKNPGQYSRWIAFGTFLKKGRDRKEQCLIEKKYSEDLPKETRLEIFNECSAYALNPAELPGILTDEEAFVFCARWILERVRIIKNSENLLVWNRKDPAAITEGQNQDLKMACDAIPKLNFPVFAKTLKKAGAYCEQLRARDKIVPYSVGRNVQALRPPPSPSSTCPLGTPPVARSCVLGPEHFVFPSLTGTILSRALNQIKNPALPLG